MAQFIGAPLRGNGAYLSLRPSELEQHQGKGSLEGIGEGWEVAFAFTQLSLEWRFPENGGKSGYWFKLLDVSKA